MGTKWWLISFIGIFILLSYLASIYFWKNDQVWSAMHMAVSVSATALIGSGIVLLQQSIINKIKINEVKESLKAEIEQTISHFDTWGELVIDDTGIDFNGITFLSPIVYEHAISTGLFSQEMVGNMLCILSAYTMYNKMLNYVFLNPTRNGNNLLPVAIQTVKEAKEHIKLTSRAFLKLL